MKDLIIVEVGKDDNVNIDDICWPWGDNRAVLISDDDRMWIQVSSDTFRLLEDVAMIKEIKDIRKEMEKYATIDKSWLEMANFQPVTA